VVAPRAGALRRPATTSSRTPPDQRVGIRYHLGVDGVPPRCCCDPFVARGTIMSWKIEKSPKGYHAMYLLP
jgi:hypothetical protein